MYRAYPADRFPTLIVMRRRTAILAALTVAVGATVAEGAASSRPRVGGCTVFPADNPWNQRVVRDHDGAADLRPCDVEPHADHAAQLSKRCTAFPSPAAASAVASSTRTSSAPPP